VTDVKAEVNRAMEMEELKKMKENMDTAMTDVHASVLNATTQLNQGIESLGQTETTSNTDYISSWKPPQPEYKHPGKNWRLKRSAIPHWYKARQGVRTKALSGAARVARYRPSGN
jgi:sec-independent protein translocase protein TatB